MTGGFVGGSGTLNYVAKWTPNGVTIGNSVMYDDGTNVGVGISSLLGARLHVKGTGNTSGTYGLLVDSSTVPNLFYVRNDGEVSSLNGYWINGSKVMYINPNSTTDNIFVGTNSGNTTMTGVQNTGLGSDVLTGLTSGIGNTGFGKQTLIHTNSGNYNTAIGLQAMSANTTNDYNVAIGYRALWSANNTQNTAVGAYCLSGAAGLGNVGVGYDVMSSGTGGYNVGIGRSVFGGASYSASYNIGIGNRVGATITTGNYNVIIGYDSVFNVLTTGAQNTILGSLITVDAAGRTGSIALGYGAAITGNNQFVVGSAGVNAGTVTAEAVTSDATWSVIINGTAYKILLKA